MEKVKQPHVGVFLQELLDDFSMSTYTLSKIADICVSELDDILQGRELITKEVASKLGKAFNTTDKYWLNLQKTCGNEEVNFLRRELRVIVEYILPEEQHDEDVIENYVNSLVLLNEEYTNKILKQL